MIRFKTALSLASFLLLPCACSRKPPIDRVVLISLDATRADHVDTGQGGRAWTPHLRRFAAGSWVFENAYSPIPQTLPAHLALLSGRLPQQLGVPGNEAVYDGRRPLLSQELQRRGWDTAGIVSLGTLAKATGFARGFDRFNDPVTDPGQFSARAQRVTDMALAELERSSGKKRFLFVHYADPHSPYAAPGVQGRFTIELDRRPVASFNAYTGAILRLRLALSPGVHRLRFRSEAPDRDFDYFILRRLQAGNGSLRSLQNLEFSPEYYEGSYLLRHSEGLAIVHCPAPGELSLFQVIPILTANAARENYRREVQYMDGEVGRLLQALAAGPAADRTIVIVFADHGEGLGERENYVGHVRYLNRQFIHVPLIARFPGEAPRRFRAAVGLSEISPWIVEALGITDSALPAAPVSWQGLRRGRSDPGIIPSFTFSPASGKDRCSLINWPYQLIISRHPSTGSETREYYDLRRPSECLQSAIPSELVLLQAPQQWRQFEAWRPRWQAAFARWGRRNPHPDPGQMEALKTAGYIRRP